MAKTDVLMKHYAIIHNTQYATIDIALDHKLDLCQKYEKFIKIS